jgi:YcxB-like protein
MPEPVTGTFDQSVEVGLRGVRALHAKQLRRDRWIGIACLIVAPFAALYSIWFVPFLLAFGLLLWLGLLDPQLMQVRMLYRRNPDLQHPVDVIADETGITFRSPGSTTRLEWSRYKRLIEGPDVFVLVFGKDLIHIIPMEAFVAAEDGDEFRRLARKALPRS